MTPTLTKFFKGMAQENITQIFHEGHDALDIVGNTVNFGYGTPLCAPENSLVIGIKGETYNPDSLLDLEQGYGVRFKGLETGLEWLYWHCLPYFPVWGGQNVARGQIVAFMGNAGNVSTGGAYVPLEERTSAPFKGTHLHVEARDNGSRVDPLPMINWDWEPQYSTADLINAIYTVVTKALKSIK